MQLMNILFTLLMSVVIAGCESNPPAPIIDRAPETKPKPPAKPVSKSTDVGKDWRPDSHIVKKGDTLFGIGLEYGVDYKEIAAANNIVPPYPIKIGQLIDLKSFKIKIATPSVINKTVSDSNSDGVVDNKDGAVILTPMKTEPDIVSGKTADSKASDGKASADKPLLSVVTPVLTEPKAMREPYSLEALNRTTAKPTVIAKPSDAKPSDAKPSDTKQTETKPADTIATGDEAINWIWPTQGKITASFNEANNKGIDIGGDIGQAIKAASAGKVIYSGSDLRGYGKLVIIKHNKTYLSVYAHNSKIVVKEGMSVLAGQKIAEMGNTDANSVKLHFEIRRLGKSVDPAKYLN